MTTGSVVDVVTPTAFSTIQYVIAFNTWPTPITPAKPTTVRTTVKASTVVLDAAQTDESKLGPIQNNIFITVVYL